MNDSDLLTAAMTAAEYFSTRRFAEAVLGVDERAIRRWLSGERELQGTVRIICAAIIARPGIVRELEAARWSLVVPEPTLITHNGETFVVEVRPEFAGVRAPWCVNVGGGWYEVDEYHELDRVAPREALSFIGSIGKERGPAWLATRETPLLFVFDHEVVRCHTSAPVANSPRWVFEHEGSSSGGASADPDDTIEDVQRRAEEWLRTKLSMERSDRIKQPRM